MAEQSRKFTLGATGDILLHDRLYNKAKTKDGGYDFSGMLAEAKPLFKKDHLTIVNQESIMGGEELGLSSFPRFNSPIEIGQTLKSMNVDIVNMANNHVMDKGEEGILAAIKNWEELDMPYVGAYKSEEDRNTLRIFHKNGLKVCFLSYTRNLGMKIPQDKGFLVGRYMNDKILSISKEIRKISNLGVADIIVLSLHFGEEYHMLPSSSQYEISASLSDAGADVILGHHPHVLQPPAYILNSRGKETFCIYSLGNFFSGQKGIYRQIGAHMTIDIEKPSEKKHSQVKLNNPSFKLTFVDSSQDSSYKLYLLEDIVKNWKTIKTHMGEFSSEDVYNRMISHMKKWIPNLNIS